MTILSHTHQEAEVSRHSAAENFPHPASALAEPHLMTSCSTLCPNEVQRPLDSSY